MVRKGKPYSMILHRFSQVFDVCLSVLLSVLCDLNFRPRKYLADYFPLVASYFLLMVSRV